MAPKSKSIEEIATKFPFKTLPIIDGDPDYASLSEMTRALYGNATSLPTMLGDSAHGHMGMIVKDKLYTTTVVMAWDQPGTLAALVIPNNETGSRGEKLK